MLITPEQIRAGRKALGLRVKTCAEQAGVKFRTWSNWEAPAGTMNHREVRPYMVPLICEVIGFVPIVLAPDKIIPYHYKFANSDLPFVPLSGSVLKRYRQLLGLSQEEAGASVHVTRYAWMGWEKQGATRNSLLTCAAELFCMIHKIPYFFQGGVIFVVCPDALKEKREN